MRSLPSIVLALVALCVRGAEPSAEERFRTDVWPLLERSCLRCHGAEKQKSGLRLDSREAALKGGESGAALVPGQPEESLLLRLVRHLEEDRKMPPKEKLSEAEVASLERWIAGGAPWPAPAPITAKVILPGEKLGDAWTDARNPIVKLFAGQRLDLWSLKPIAHPPSPAVAQPAFVVRNPIDAFILTRLDAEQVAPAPEADGRTLCRRLTFDLVGLPPTPEEMETFVSAYEAPGADREAVLSAKVEQLLGSPRYGEHWARLWLDVVRYSDSNGFDWDEFRPQAWRFRDYVIRSFNADKPFSRFLREQLAGDEMVDGAPRDAPEQDCLIATTYLRLGPYDNSAAQFGEGPRVRAALMNDLVETTGSACLGLTMVCARCHNHKFDPISQADYYRLRAFFEGVKLRDDLPLDLAPEQEAIRQHNEGIEARMKERRGARDAVLAGAKERLRAARVAKLIATDRVLLELPAMLRGADAKKRIQALEKEVTPPDPDIKAALTPEEKKRHGEADAEVQALKKQLRPFTTGLLMADENAAPPVTYVLFQGDLAKTREAVPPGFLSALDPNAARIEKPVRRDSSGRRTALADWLVSNRNPLVARVLVNRIWQAHFGEGLVATANDFGLNGARPTHPELLDWLAGEFMREGWSLKKLHRLIVTSSTYRQSAPLPAVAGRHLFAGQAPRRLSAEALRDATLAVAGKLRLTSGGPPIWPEIPEEVLKTNPAFLDDNAEKTKGWYPTPHDQSAVRSIYLVQKRNLRVPMLETFDQPDNALSCPRRNVSTVAPQALTLLNGPLATEMATALAERVQREADHEPKAQIERAFRIALQRAPDPDEQARCTQFLAQHSLPELCRALLNLNEFAYID